MGVADNFGWAFAKAQMGVGGELPLEGTVFLSVNDNDKATLLPIARRLAQLGFKLLGTSGTASYLGAQGLPVQTVFKVNEGHPNIADRIASGEVQLAVNTPLGKESFYDETAIRKASLAYGVPCITTLSGSRAAVDAIRTLRAGDWDVESLQEGRARRARAELSSRLPDRPSG